MRGCILPLVLAVASCAPTTSGAQEGPPLAPLCDCGPRHINICIMEGGALRQVLADYKAQTGDTLVNGKPFSSVYRLTSDYAAATEWFTRNEPIPFAGRSFRKAGLPRVLGIDEVVRVGEFHGVSLFAARDTTWLPRGRLYVPLRTGCEFQPYEPEP